MRTFIKIVLTIVAFVIATPIFALAEKQPALKVIFLAGLVGGIVAIWKYNPNNHESAEINKSTDQDKHQLNKE